MMIKKIGALLLSVVLCIGMAAPAFAFEGEATPVEQPVMPEVVEDVVTVTDETSGALTPEGNLTLVDDYHTDYSDGSGQQFITLVSKSGATFYLVIDRNAKGQHTAVVSYENRNSPQVEKDRTCHRIAEENGVGRSYVIDAEKYAAGIDQIEEIQPGMKESILTRKTKATAAEIASVARAPPEERPALVAEICKPKSPKPPAQKQKAPPAVAAPLPDASTSDEKAPDEEPTSTPAPSEPIFPQKENEPLKVDRQQILEIANNRYHVKQLANGAAMLCEVSGAANSMMRRWESVFREYPDILSDVENRASVGRTIQKLRDYLKNLEDKMEELL